MNDSQKIINFWRKACLQKKGAIEDTPFGPDALVYKVAGKMFALLSQRKDGIGLNLKCDPQEALLSETVFQLSPLAII